MAKQTFFYLCHPYSTFGNIAQNVKTAELIKENLRNKGYIIISPLNIIPEHLDWVTAMDVSKSLYDKCDALVIGSDNWIHSKGCVMEIEWCLESGKPIYLYSEITKSIAGVAGESMRRLFKHMIENQKEGNFK